MVLQSIIIISLLYVTVSAQLCLSDYDCPKTLVCKKITNAPYNVCGTGIGNGVSPMKNQCTSDIQCPDLNVCILDSIGLKVCQNPTYCSTNAQCSSGKTCQVHYNGLHLCQYDSRTLGKSDKESCTKDSDCRIGLRCVDYFGKLMCKNLNIGGGAQPTSACLSSTDCFNGQSCVYLASNKQYVCMWLGGFTSSVGGNVGGNTGKNPSVPSVGGNVGGNTGKNPSIPSVGGNVGGNTGKNPSIPSVGGNVGGNTGKNPSIPSVGGNVGGNTGKNPSIPSVGGNVGISAIAIRGNIGEEANSDPNSNIIQHIGGNIENPTDPSYDPYFHPKVGGHVGAASSFNNPESVNGFNSIGEPFDSSAFNTGTNQLFPFSIDQDNEYKKNNTTSSTSTTSSIQLPTYAEARVIPKANLIDPAAMPCEYDYQCRMGESCSGIVQLVDRNVTVCQYDVTKKNRMCIVHADCVQGQICSKNATGTFVCTDSYEAATGNLKCQYDYECSGGEVCANVGQDSEKKFRCRLPDYADPRRNQKCSSNIDCPYQQVCRHLSGLAMCVDIGSTVAISTGREIQEKVFKFVHDLLFARI